MKENRNYDAPKFEIIEIECEDVILTSGLTEGEEGTGLEGGSTIFSNTVNTVNLFD